MLTLSGRRARSLEFIRLKRFASLVLRLSLLVLEAILIYPLPPRFLARTVLRSGLAWEFRQGFTRLFEGLDVEIRCVRRFRGVGRILDTYSCYECVLLNCY